MPSVYEQLQKYRAQNAKNTAALLAKHPGVSNFSHPKTKEYFKALMLRWQMNAQNSALNGVSTEE
jgi:hypothetical protein